MNGWMEQGGKYIKCIDGKILIIYGSGDKWWTSVFLCDGKSPTIVGTYSSAAEAMGIIDRNHDWVPQEYTDKYSFWMSKDKVRAAFVSQGFAVEPWYVDIADKGFQKYNRRERAEAIAKAYVKGEIENLPSGDV